MVQLVYYLYILNNFLVVVVVSFRDLSKTVELKKLIFFSVLQRQIKSFFFFFFFFKKKEKSKD